MKDPWRGYFKPTKIFGNLYFVGTEPASTHIIDTGDGLIMLDSGYQQSLYLVIQNMHAMGLDPLKLKYIVHTHGHIDHFGATRSLVELTGAKTFLGAPDREYANGTLDLSYAKELLISTDLKVFEVGIRSGFSSLSNFLRAFKLEFGKTPQGFRQMSIGAGIR